MKGSVADHHLLMSVDFTAPTGLTSIEMVVDTGYVGTLTLPATTVRSLALPFLRNMVAKLADGSSIDIDVHLATIVWHGGERQTEVIVLDDRPLIGMVLLDGSHMSVRFENGGAMELTKLEISDGRQDP